ncbi:Acyltransferase [Cyanidiococcus yangmingshanensis]|uniref:Acyltransferase n=1 Tax=Cyanidiococcus yangmingshanensis TaxID=2690220 RepID=A0A7J7IGI8_9RHOD|nr:Acyltransferase [Cyanidiococcus yangmingshanensis]
MRRSELLHWGQAIRQVRSAIRAHGLRLWVEALVTWAETVGGLELLVTGDDMRPDESCIVLANHRSWVDSLIVFCLAVNAGRAGDFRFLGKRSLANLPIIGLAAKLTGGVLFISRNYARDEAKMQRTYRQLTYRRAPFWFTIFPEGTRLNAEEKLKQAREYYHRVRAERSSAEAVQLGRCQRGCGVASARSGWATGGAALLLSAAGERIPTGGSRSASGPWCSLRLYDLLRESGFEWIVTTSRMGATTNSSRSLFESLPFCRTTTFSSACSCAEDTNESAA